MDTPDNIPSQLRNQTLSTDCSNGNEKISNSSSLSNSPEFEFWSVLQNPTVPDAARILSAEELFSDGVLLPLDLLSLSRTRKSGDPPDREGSGPAVPDQHGTPYVVPEQETRPGTLLASPPEPETGSKRWMDIFKKNERKSPLKDQVEDVRTPVGKEKEIKERLEKEKRKEKRSRGGSGSPELNINIWPFSRSRSAGNGRTRPVIPPGAPATRKVSSAPCSRSNSAGDPKSRCSNNGYKWPSIPGRVRVHVSRSSPIWQPRRGRASAWGLRSSITSRKNPYTETKARVLNVNVPTMRYAPKSRLGCRNVASNGATGGDGGGGSLFNLRGLFAKKVH